VSITFYVALLALSMTAISTTMNIRWRVAWTMINVFVIVFDLLKFDMW